MGENTNKTDATTPFRNSYIIDNEAVKQTPEGFVVRSVRIWNIWNQLALICPVDGQCSRVLRSKHLFCKSMGIMIESSVWEPKASLYIFIFLASFLSILLLPNFSKKTLTPFDHGTSPSFLRFQRHFLLIFSLASGNSSYLVFSSLQLSSIIWSTTCILKRI